MQLLGVYSSRLQAFHYQELLSLYKQAIANGEFAGNKTFDEQAINNLISQSEDFSNLAVAAEGQRVTDDSLNTPLNLLRARFNAISSEAKDFDQRTSSLIQVLKKDTQLLDQLLSAAGLNDWVAEQPELNGATKFSWDFGMGNGPTSSIVAKIDPSNGVTYPTNCPTNTYLDVVDADQFEGLVAPESIRSIEADNLQWSWTPMTPGEQSEPLYGDGWAELNLLEDHPLVNFLPDPVVQVVLPVGGSIAGVFNVGGSVSNGSLPIYVRIAFTPRRNSIVITPQNAMQDPGFEGGGIGWTLENPWSLQNDSNGHTGSKYVSKGTLPAWSSAITYSSGNQVSFNGQEWVSLINSNTNNVPSAPQSTSWARTGHLISPSFPLDPQSKVYIETWVKDIGGNGSVNIALSCRDIDDNEITPQVAVPGVTSAQDWTKVSEVLQSLSDPNVVAGRLIVTTTGQTTGNWLMDDFRIHLPQNISPYSVSQDDISVYIPKEGSTQPSNMFFVGADFVVDDISNVTFMDLQDGVAHTVRFTESFPGYQCSVNEKVFSPLIMLDPARPYPDDEKLFNPISIGIDSKGNQTLFPITDEVGAPTGLTLQMVSRPLFEYYFQVNTAAQPQYGASVVLEVDLSTPTFITGLTLSPFSVYPMRLTKIEAEPFASDTRQTLGSPNVLLDRPLVLTFPTTLLRKIFLTCYQESYDLTETVVQPQDALRRNTLFSIQSTLPFSVRRPQRALPTFLRGAQYVFGLEDLAGISATPILPGVFVSGAWHFKGCPEVFRFDTSYFDPNSIPNTNFYLCWQAFNSAGAVVNQQLSGVQITPGECAIWPFPSLSLLDRSTVDHVEVFLKFVIRDPNTVIQRFLLQIRGV